MNRRFFLSLLGVAGAARAPLGHTQQRTRLRRIGVLSYLGQHDSEAPIYLTAFTDALRERGWPIGQGVQIDARWTAGDQGLLRRYAQELVGLDPDVILIAGGSHVVPVQQLTRTVPIVFVQVTDPVGGGYVESLSHPGGNTTGFTVFEFDIGAKWLELLKQVAPRTTRVAVLRDPRNPSGTGLFGAMQAVAPRFGVDVNPIGVADEREIDRGIAAFAASPNGGLVVTPNGGAIVYREFIVGLAARHRLPAIYPFRDFAQLGGLVSYGPDVVDQYRRAAEYVDRILKGEKPGDLPVQRAAKLELVVNAKTANRLGIELPQAMLLSADTVLR